MHKPFLLAALNQARLGRGKCAPNPAVGAVAVRDNQIIAQATHLGAGTSHAEKLLLEKLAPNLDNLTLYVTLEPCNHWGRTPPCVEAIIKYGIKRVVYAYHDPNPLVSINNTPLILKANGIDVIHYPLPEIDEFYQSYRHWTLTKKPFITVKIAQSLDSKIAGLNGEPVRISNDECNFYTHQQRLYTDAILTSANTVNMDDPLLNARLNTETIPKNIVILDRTLKVNPNSRVFNHAKECHIFYDERLEVKNVLKNTHYHPVKCNKVKLPLKSVTYKLGELGFHDVWAEFGKTLFNEIHTCKLVDKTLIYISSDILGENALSLYENNHIFNAYREIKWHPLGNNVVLSLLWNESVSKHNKKFSKI